jgi:HKD family nuclease
MFILQDPTAENSTYLLESIADALEGAHHVAGAFAFATSAGVGLLADTPNFRRLAETHSVDLVVGTDAVTNTAALDRLAAVSRLGPQVRVRAFLNPRPQILFHPKFLWTKNGDGGRLITGSGNLTGTGLTENWEAYTVDQLDAGSLNAVEQTWNTWTTAHDLSLRTMDNPDIRARAAANNVLAREGDLPVVDVPAANRQPPVPPAVRILPDTSPVLIAEIPRSGDRWKQVNFQKADFVEYFGAQPDGRLMVFRHVREDGMPGQFESERPPVEVASQNYRFELAAAQGLEYPAAGRPIGVYVRTGARSFLYRLVMPADRQHATVSGILDRRGVASRAGGMRSIRMSVAELRREWPGSPFWNLPPAD